MTEKQRFSAICDEERNFPTESIPSGIGTYMEKRLHRVLKAFFSDSGALCEAEIGNYIADVYSDGHIIEIQTGSFKPLLPKLKYYLETTDCKISVVKPLLAENAIVRMDKDTGEILRQRRSSRHEDIYDLIAELYHLRELIPNDRLEFTAMLIRAEEYRYSERMRYRREGAYDAELFPTELLSITVFSNLSDFERFLPPKDSFTAKEYSTFIKKKGRAVYSILNFLCYVGLLQRKKEGNHYLYYRYVR